MNQYEIAELFIKTAEIDRRLRVSTGPAKLKAMNLGYVHTFEDMNGWGEQDKHDANWEWLKPENLRVTASEVTLWEKANDLVCHVPIESYRKCLMRWAMAKAGGRPFSKWCRQQGFHEMTGQRRMKRAIAYIEQHFARGGSPNYESGNVVVLPVASDLGHIVDNIGSDATAYEKHWRDDETELSKAVAVWDWRQYRNDRRRQAYRQKQMECSMSVGG